MKYRVPEGVTAIYNNGRRYPVEEGIVEIPGEPVDWLKPVRKSSRAEKSEKE